jgi:hypothetical protein
LYSPHKNFYYIFSNHQGQNQLVHVRAGGCTGSTTASGGGVSTTTPSSLRARRLSALLRTGSGAASGGDESVFFRATGIDFLYDVRE